MNEPIGQIPEGNLCNVIGQITVLSQLPDPQTETLLFDGVIDIESNLDYLLDVPREQQLLVKVATVNRPIHGVLPAFLQGAYVRATGLLLIDYDGEGKPHLYLAADRVVPQPGDPWSQQYVERGFAKSNPDITFTGVVTRIPVDRPDCQVYTFSLRVPREDGTTDLGWDGTYSVYDIHCAIPMTARWANSPHWIGSPLPQIGDVCQVMGELSGLYRVGDRYSPLVRMSHFHVLQLLPPPEEEDDEMGEGEDEDDVASANDDAEDGSGNLEENS
ncbi:hypothetical protein VTN31DRAFT_5238 [Thermomyces dupontii]|uniref:uncharacterized protein n=1 Tax=Talaromyces thermophilus TaxID=28565 RepID=UPI003743CDC5